MFKKMNRGKRPASDAIFCHKCQITFTEEKSLSTHKRKFHLDQGDMLQQNQVCAMCNERFRIISELHVHLHKDHDVCLNFQSENFYSNEDFIKWKTKVEKETVSKFIMKRTKRNDDGVKLEYYICHRSGMSNLKADRECHTKASGSINHNHQYGSTCPAVMNVAIQTVEGISEIKVQFQSVHIGHEEEVGKLSLTKAERTNLTLQLDQDVSTSKILDQTIEQYSPTKRFGLITRQDMQNICKDFSIESKVMLNADDSTLVDVIVKKMLDSEDNPILVYKPVGELLNDFPEIEKHEFILGIMNNSQLNLFEMYGGSGVMVDSTQKNNQYGFQLTTLMVHNLHHESFPVAILFSSRVVEAALLPFFMKIKEKLPNMKTEFIMSDDTTSFFNAWREAFKDDSKHILCSCHVIKHLNLNVNSKVKFSDKVQVKKELKLLLTEVDKAIFEVMLNNFLHKYKKDEEEFVNYFFETYCGRTDKWAYCYRVASGIDTNLKLEHWHRQMKHEDAGGTVMKRLDKTLSVVLNAVAKKVLPTIISLQREKLISQVAVIHQQHQASLHLSESGYKIYELGNGQVTVSSSLTPYQSCIFSYTIEKNKDDCACNIRCNMCNICVHSMSCTCVDYSTQFVICKHIHFLQQSRIQGQALKAEISDAHNDDAKFMVDLDEGKAKRDAKKEAIIPTLVNNCKHMRCILESGEEEYRKETFSIMDRVFSRIKNFNCSSNNLKYIQESMKTLDSYLDCCEPFNSEPPFKPEASRNQL